MRPFGNQDPAIYLLNACRVTYDVAAPPSTGSEQEKLDWGRYAHNYGACQQYYSVLEEFRSAGAERLNRAICRSWAYNAKDFDCGSHHVRVDFSYVNDVLEDNACHREYKNWHRRSLEGGIGGNATIETSVTIGE
ncbi:hypothetical protein DDE82_005369 [Stemphylium lycopersici]|uniref:Uncharacterized protein n=1 Tax=Stemphylium lycopersici TaxID=183478 RepID=A0A364MWW8_STELY|nr:hypothetical protein TW65_04842 [Stemphylium lycopersici]RAR03182.1 hypothetical protein DDE82_005369 [Stemphylium lycopersici]RAR05893.1 hypothetical protein DDE83_007164 [Stemphylium lycopersici]